MTCPSHQLHNNQPNCDYDNDNDKDKDKDEDNDDDGLQQRWGGTVQREN